MEMPAKNASVFPMMIYGTIFVKRPNIPTNKTQNNEINRAFFIPNKFFIGGKNNNIAETINAKR